MTKLVLFDCDGVLINSEDIGFKILQTMLADEGHERDLETLVSLFSGKSNGDFLKSLQADFNQVTGGTLPDDFGETLQARFKKAQENGLKALPGVKDLLSQMKGYDLPMAVCSNSGAENLLKKLRQTELYDQFVPHIFSSTHVDKPKPAPDLYLHAAAVRGIKDPRNCLVIEDSAVGVQAGVAAGMKVAGFTGGQGDESVKAQQLRAAGATQIVDNHKQTWQEIAEFTRHACRFPYMGSGLTS